MEESSEGLGVLGRGSSDFKPLSQLTEAHRGAVGAVALRSKSSVDPAPTLA